MNKVQERMIKVLEQISTKEDSGKFDIFKKMISSLIIREIQPALDDIAMDWENNGGSIIEEVKHDIYPRLTLGLNMKDVFPDVYNVYIQISHEFNEIFDKNSIIIKIQSTHTKTIHLPVNEVNMEKVYDLITESIY